MWLAKGLTVDDNGMWVQVHCMWMNYLYRCGGDWRARYTRLLWSPLRVNGLPLQVRQWMTSQVYSLLLWVHCVWMDCLYRCGSEWRARYTRYCCGSSACEWIAFTGAAVTDEPGILGYCCESIACDWIRPTCTGAAVNDKPGILGYCCESIEYIGLPLQVRQWMTSQVYSATATLSMITSRWSRTSCHCGAVTEWQWSIRLEQLAAGGKAACMARLSLLLHGRLHLPPFNSISSVLHCILVSSPYTCVTDSTKLVHWL